MVNERLNTPLAMDANDFLYQWESSRDFNPGSDLEKIKAKVLVINSADDERNPPELGIMQNELKRVKSAELYLIPASEQTSGHSTTGQAKWWKEKLSQWMAR